jgi:hypothetical protein
MNEIVRKSAFRIIQVGGRYFEDLQEGAEGKKLYRLGGINKRSQYKVGDGSWPRGIAREGAMKILDRQGGIWMGWLRQEIDHLTLTDKDVYIRGTTSPRPHDSKFCRPERSLSENLSVPATSSGVWGVCPPHGLKLSQRPSPPEVTRCAPDLGTA